MIDLKNLRGELDLQSELERSAAPHRTDAPTTQTGRDALTQFSTEPQARPLEVFSLEKAASIGCWSAW